MPFQGEPRTTPKTFSSAFSLFKTHVKYWVYNCAIEIRKSRGGRKKKTNFKNSYWTLCGHYCWMQGWHIGIKSDIWKNQYIGIGTSKYIS